MTLAQVCIASRPAVRDHQTSYLSTPAFSEFSENAIAPVFRQACHRDVGIYLTVYRRLN
jgi:hypothetical protein